MKLISLFFAVFLTMIMATVGFAQDTLPVPEIDLLSKLAELLLSWGSLSVLAKGSIIVLILTQVAKQLTDFKYKNLMVAIFSVAYGVVQMMMNDVKFGSAAILILISGGGAMLIYNAAKPLLKKIPFLSFLNLGSK